PSRPLDILLSNGVQARFGRVSLAPLCGVDVEGDIDEPRRGQLLEQIARCSNSVGHEGWPQVAPRDAPDDLHELLSLAKRRIAARHLNPDSGTVDLTDSIDSPEHDVERKVLHRLGAFGEVAECTVEIAALSDLQRHATDRGAAAKHLIRSPKGGIEAFPRCAEHCRTFFQVLELRKTLRKSFLIHLRLQEFNR